MSTAGGGGQGAGAGRGASGLLERKNETQVFLASFPTEAAATPPPPARLTLL